MNMRYNVTVKFNTDAIEVDGDTITVGIRSKPERGRANRELIDKLAKAFWHSCLKCQDRSRFKV